MTAGRLLGGRYEVGELLGYGGMAEVHHGRDLRLGRDVAIKMLRVDLARDATFQMRFSREAQNAAALNHPAIVAVYDTGEERGMNGEALPYIVMEFVNGRTLKEILTSEGPLPPRRALEISADICLALEYSHRHGIIHRDIKPGNVMLNQAGQVKVMDFGIARALASGASTMTQTSAVIGTAQYLSPEQARGEAVDARSDVYATGCVVFELLTGRPPFVGDNPVSVAYQHVREDARPPSDTNREIPRDVDAIVLKALAKNPLNRYQSAAEMRADLLRAAAGRPVLATPVLRGAQMPTEVATRVAGPAGTRTTTPVRVSPPSRRGSTGLVVTLVVLGLLALAALGAGLYLTTRPPNNTTVPYLIGMNITDAKVKLQQSQLVAGRSSDVNDTKCKLGDVVGTTPVAGKHVPVQSTVDLQVCAGPGSVSGGVPNVVGLQVDAAESQLRAIGLSWTINNVDDVAPSKQVTATDPPAGTPIADGGSVTLSVSRGNLADLPSLIGFTKDAAIAELKHLGFNSVQTLDNTVAPANMNGLVTSQLQGPGRYLKSTKITIYVGKNNGETPPTSPPPSSPSSSPGG
jgi:beta-lactam-binding protein with PASTA domain/predicted Ser/Thr protein kinase